VISSVQKNKKSEKKKLLLQQICLKMEKERGIPHSLNEAIIHSTECLLNDMHLSPKQRSKIENAAQSAKMTPQQILDKACDWASRFYGQKYAAEKSSQQFTAGSAYRRVEEFVKAVMKKNDSTKLKENKIFINQTYLIKNQGSNRDAVKGFLELNRELLESHHRKHGLRPRHNIEVNSYRKKSKG
jgi:hypothetical protein